MDSGVADAKNESIAVDTVEWFPSMAKRASGRETKVDLLTGEGGERDAYSRMRFLVAGLRYCPAGKVAKATAKLNIQGLETCRLECALDESVSEASGEDGSKESVVDRWWVGQVLSRSLQVWFWTGT